jgi:ABC-type sugar transport system permease subunit
VVGIPPPRLFAVIFDFLRRRANRLIAAVAIAVGVGGVFALFWAMNQTSTGCRPRREGVRPHVQARRRAGRLPIYPVNAALSPRPRQRVGRAGNYQFAFTDENMLRSMRNTAMWIVLVPLVAVSVGSPSPPW